MTLYSVGEADDDGDEPSRKQRLQELRLAQRLIANNSGSLLLFDEMEDLLEDSFGGFGMFGPLRSSRSGEATSKVFMHRLLEQTPAPTLWTMNDADEVSPAILRRMMFALELRPPTATVRTRVWARQLDRHDIAATPEEVTTLASEFDAAPGVAAGATAAASLAGGDIAAVRTGVRSLARLLSCDRPPQRAPAGFDPALIRADTDPTALADSLAESGRRRFSLCLQGPPGTGKSAYVRYLAERLGLEVVQKRASDLMSMWVGQTEKIIARAFAEARDAGAFLVFDEADSLPGGPAPCPAQLGSQPGQRDADLDGEPSFALRLHNQFWGPSRPGDAAPLRLQGDARLSRTRTGRGGVPQLFRSAAAALSRNTRCPHTRRLRSGA